MALGLVFDFIDSVDAKAATIQPNKETVTCVALVNMRGIVLG